MPPATWERLSQHSCLACNTCRFPAAVIEIYEASKQKRYLFACLCLSTYGILSSFTRRTPCLPKRGLPRALSPLSAYCSLLESLAVTILGAENLGRERMTASPSPSTNPHPKAP